MKLRTAIATATTAAVLATSGVALAGATTSSGSHPTSPSTSAASDRSPEEPTQALTSPLALSNTSTAPSSTLRPRNSASWLRSASMATRCTPASSVVRIERTPSLVSACGREVAAVRVSAGAGIPSIGGWITCRAK
jgi:hypothetical protein